MALQQHRQKLTPEHNFWMVNFHLAGAVEDANCILWLRDDSLLALQHEFRQFLELHPDREFIGDLHRGTVINIRRQWSGLDKWLFQPFQHQVCIQPP